MSISMRCAFLCGSLWFCVVASRGDEGADRPDPAAGRAITNGPLRDHPDNPRYFADGEGRVVYLTGSHTWSNLVDIGPGDPPPRFDFDASRECARRVDLARMTPRIELASTSYCLADPGRAYLMYLPDGGKVSVDLSAASGELATEWFDPATGERLEGESTAGGGTVELAAPFPGSAVLYVSAGGEVGASPAPGDERSRDVLFTCDFEDDDWRDGWTSSRNDGRCETVASDPERGFEPLRGKGGRGLLENDRWYAIEQYAKMNTPGENDGVLRAWVDGELAFEKSDVRMRDVDTLKLEAVWINVYLGGSWTAESEHHLYIDEVAISKAPIGMLDEAQDRP